MSKNIRTTGARAHVFLLVFGLGWTLFSAIFVIVGFGDGGLGFILIGGLFVLIGLVITAFGAMTFYTRFRIGKPDIDISQTTLRVGDSLSMSYLHQFRSTVEVNELRVQLIFRETATYQQGTDTRTVTHDHIMEEYREPGRHFQGGNRVANTYQFQIPPAGMHTLKVRRNKLEWFLRFQLEVPRLPDFVNEYELTVLPELVGE